MRKLGMTAVAAALVAAFAAPALAHVTVQPNEGLAESFSAFVVRVPNESEEASTIKIQGQLPPLAGVMFQDVPGWERSIEMRTLDEPIELFGEEITEVVGSVTWSGGEIQPGEFEEFPFSAPMPAGENELVFKFIQTYSDGEVARWTGPEDAEHPAARLHTVELGDFLAEGSGQLGALHEVVHELEEVVAKVEELEAQSGSEPTAAPPASEASAEEPEEAATDAKVWVALALGALGLLLGIGAFVRSGSSS